MFYQPLKLYSNGSQVLSELVKRMTS